MELARKSSSWDKKSKMNGFSNHGLDEDAFGEKKGNLVQAFDAFRTNHISIIFKTSGWYTDLIFIFQLKQSPNT